MTVNKRNIINTIIQDGALLPVWMSIYCPFILIANQSFSVFSKSETFFPSPREKSSERTATAPATATETLSIIWTAHMRCARQQSIRVGWAGLALSLPFNMRNYVLEKKIVAQPTISIERISIGHHIHAHTYTQNVLDSWIWFNIYRMSRLRCHSDNKYTAKRTITFYSNEVSVYQNVYTNLLYDIDIGHGHACGMRHAIHQLIVGNVRMYI